MQLDVFDARQVCAEQHPLQRIQHVRITNRGTRGTQLDAAQEACAGMAEGPGEHVFHVLFGRYVGEQANGECRLGPAGGDLQLAIGIGPDSPG